MISCTHELFAVIHIINWFNNLWLYNLTIKKLSFSTTKGDNQSSCLFFGKTAHLDGVRRLYPELQKPSYAVLAVRRRTAQLDGLRHILNWTIRSLHYSAIFRSDLIFLLSFHIFSSRLLPKDVIGKPRAIVYFSH